MNNLPNLVHRLSRDPFNYLLNFDVAREYLEQGQTASAVSFFLRCAEYGVDEPKADSGHYVYASLCAIANCFDTQSGREFSVSNTLLQAIAYDDTLPHAYFLLARFHEKANNWQECYTMATLGLSWSYENAIKDIDIELGYEGEYCLIFEKAVSAWWIGRKQESLDLLRSLKDNDSLSPIYKQSVIDNLIKLEGLNASI